MGMGAGGLQGGRFEGVHMCMCMWHEHASRCTGKCAEGCRDSTGLVGVVVLTLRCLSLLLLLLLFLSSELRAKSQRLGLTLTRLYALFYLELASRHVPICALLCVPCTTLHIVLHCIKQMVMHIYRLSSVKD